MVQTRHAEWRRSATQRRRTYAITLNFAFPGLMSLLSLVDPRSQTIWRVSFAAVSILGVVALVGLGWVTRGGGRTGLLPTAALLVAALLYALVAVVAIAPGVPSGSGPRSRRCERRRSSSRCSSTWA